MKIKIFECPKSIKDYGMSDAWSKSCLSHQHSEPAHYIVDCRFSSKSTYRTFLLTLTADLHIYWVIGCENLQNPMVLSPKCKL